MKSLTTSLAVALIAGLTLGSEWLSSQWMGRHQQQHLLDRASTQMAELPQHFGNWQMRSEESLSDSAVKVLECPAYFNRQYVNSETGEAVHAMLLVGPAGPMVAHRPEICFNGQYTLLSEPRPVVVRKDDRGIDEFFVSRFQAKSLLGEHVSTYYAWLRDTHWEAPQNVRLALGGEPMLYKLQVVCAAESGSEPLAGSTEKSPTAPQDAATRFLKDLLPVLQPHLVHAQSVP